MLKRKKYAHKWEARKLQSYPLHIAFSKMRHQVSSKNCQLHILLPRIQGNRNTLHEMCSRHRFHLTLLPSLASKTSPSQTASTACRMLSMSICKQGDCRPYMVRSIYVGWVPYEMQRHFLHNLPRRACIGDARIVIVMSNV